ncbi:MAG: serine hydrolase, partial [Maricaulaceae bacterium]
GEINLDSTLAEYAPDAPFPNAVHPDDVTLRDLLTHTSGISNDPIAFRSAYTGEHTPELLWRLLGVSEVNEDAPHGTFQYTNTGYNILTVLTDRELGVRWQELIAREIIEPAGMTRTSASMLQAAQEGWSVARPHMPSPDGEGMARVYLEKIDATMQSAGGMIMSANDALLWLELLVNDGEVGGRQIIPAEAVRETRARLAEVDLQFGDYLREDYGLGWYVSSYGGDEMIHHFGGFAGFRAHVSYMPEREVGVAVFTNNSVVGSFLADAVANYAYDRLAGREEGAEPRAAIIASLSERHDVIVSQIASGRADRAGRTWTLSQPIEAYTGVYESPEMGTMTVIIEENTLVAHLGVLRATAEPFTVPDSIRVELVPLSGMVIVFDVNDDGEVIAASLNGEARFERRPGSVL